MARAWNIPVISPRGNTRIVRNTTVFPNIISLHPYDKYELVRFTAFLLELYSWSHITIFVDKDNRQLETTGNSYYGLVARTERSKYGEIVNGYCLQILYIQYFLNVVSCRERSKVKFHIKHRYDRGMGSCRERSKVKFHIKHRYDRGMGSCRDSASL